jgi:hypothetical protein
VRSASEHVDNLVRSRARDFWFCYQGDRKGVADGVGDGASPSEVAQFEAVLSAHDQRRFRTAALGQHVDVSVFLGTTPSARLDRASDFSIGSDLPAAPN